MKQKLFIFFPLILFLVFPQPALAQATDAATINAGITSPTFLLIILGSSLFLAGFLIFRRLNYKPSL